MASIKAKFRPSSVKGKEGVIYYQLIQNKVVRQIGVGHKLFVEEWNENNSQVVVLNEKSQRGQYLINIRERIKLDIIRIHRISSSLDKRGVSYSADDVVNIFNRQLKGVTLFKFMREIIELLRDIRKIRTSETYITTLNSFMRFRDGEDILLTDLSAEIMMGYEAYLKQNGITMNTISFYIRILRAVYNRAVDKELVDQRYPFKRVYTGIDKTVKRALPLDNIKKIKELNLSSQPKLELAKDLFFFSFYTRGMSFVDMAYLRKRDIKNGVLSYRRRKTDQILHIKWEGCMQQIVDKYNNFDSEYLLPIITNCKKDDRKQYMRGLYNANNSLKKISEMLNITIPLTMYVARHSWASIAKNSNIPISVISEGMGHDSEATTQIYLASLDTAIVDKANNVIINLL